MKIYSDLENVYILVDYHPTHSQLLLRSMKNQHRNYNIDILIKPVFFLSIPTKIKGIEISLVTDEALINILKTNYDFDTKNYKIFSLVDSHKRIHYINASVFGVYHNNFETAESCLEKVPYVSPGECILWYK
ncbi:hypothetical protein HDF18_18935 [Mucilaginibacter sp. X5P1]|uniref:hypothetical protein n=1 Tax=Mucilaginibacter sp. X5P1 TaxID=2723088 RepID=UPI001613D479|nr:hypothetical protein [Mucilaginibacter sp. X5P1]MBB6139723.1 hypothetical protein [Mucilaginibacter sp. X5P1]